MPNLAQVYLRRFYEERVIMEDNPSHIFLLNCDVCCSFPLPSLLDAHKRYGGMGTMLVIKVSAESASQYGELVADPTTNEMLHYTEKPETFVSDLINCGVYIFSPLIFLLLSKMYLLTEKAEVVPAEVVEALLTSCKSVI